jgi:plasmid stabilization system protein ParE
VSWSRKAARNIADITRAVFREGPDERRALRRHFEHLALRRVVPYIGVDTSDGFYILPTADRAVAQRFTWRVAGSPTFCRVGPSSPRWAS